MEPPTSTFTADARPEPIKLELGGNVTAIRAGDLVLHPKEGMFYVSGIRPDGHARVWPYRASPLPHRLP